MDRRENEDVEAHESPGPGHLLLLEEEETLGEQVATALEADGWTTHRASTAGEGLTLAASLRPILVVLEAVLPDGSGLEVCRRLREDVAGEPLGIIVASARGGEADRLLGFEAGADDYLVKPYSVRELVWRVRALRRAIAPRESGTTSTAAFRWRGLELDPIKHVVRADGVLLALRPVEYKILLLLLSSTGRTFTRAELGAVVWEKPRDGSLRTINTHVSRLREVLGPYAEAIETVAGVGYRLGVES